MNKRLTCVVLFFLLAIAAVHAEDIYVKAGGKGIGKGTKDEPYSFLWKALDKAKRGDVIHVAAGTYNGKNGCGSFTIKVPQLTLVGGYNADFSSRDPFKNLTILERAKDYKGDWTGLPEGIITGSTDDHSQCIIDGLVLNGETRNAYDAGDINYTKSFKGCALQTEHADIKIRNCIILNPLGDGIYCKWTGKGNEITNTFVINTFCNAISSRSAQPDAEVRIANCTFVFCWFYPSKGGGMSVLIGRQGKLILENNILAFNQTEGDAAGYGINNSLGNSDAVLKNNLFYKCQGGYYKYMDADKKNLLLTKAEELQNLNEDPESHMLAEAGGNTDDDPQFSPDKEFLEKFENFVASTVEGDKGSVRKNYGMAYPLNAVIPNLASKLSGKGVQLAGPFIVYQTKAALTKTQEYQPISLTQFGKDQAKNYKGQAVVFKAGIGPSATSWVLKNADRKEYDCVKLNVPGEPEQTRQYIYGYLLKGSAAAKNWAKYAKKKDKYAKEGITIQGTAWYAGSDTYIYPVCVIIDTVTEK